MSEQHPADDREPGNPFTPSSRPLDEAKESDRRPVPTPHPLSGPKLSAAQGCSIILVHLTVALLGFAIICSVPLLAYLGTPFAPELAGPGPMQTWQAKLWLCLCLLVCVVATCLPGYAYHRLLRRLRVDMSDDWNRPRNHLDMWREARERGREAKGLGRSPFGRYTAAQRARRRDHERMAAICVLGMSVIFVAISLFVLYNPLGLSLQMKGVVGGGAMLLFAGVMVAVVGFLYCS